jgi:hypothetical protein
MSAKTSFCGPCEFRAQSAFKASGRFAGCYSGFEFGPFCKGLPAFCKGIGSVLRASLIIFAVRAKKASGRLWKIFSNAYGKRF